MKTRIFFLVVFVMACSYSYGQTKSKRMPLKMVHLERIEDDDLFIFIRKNLKQVPTKNVDEIKHLNQIYIGCKPGNYSAKILPIYYTETITALRSPRRDISAIVLMYGGVIEKMDGGFSILGSRNEPLTFIDGVKTRGNPILPAATVSDVVVLKHGIPADMGDSNSGVIFISSLNNTKN